MGRLNREVRRRTDAVEIFPNPVALPRLSTCGLIDSYDARQVAERRFLSEESMAQLTPSAPTAITAATNKPEVVDTDAIRTAQFTPRKASRGTSDITQRDLIRGSHRTSSD